MRALSFILSTVFAAAVYSLTIPHLPGQTTKSSGGTTKDCGPNGCTQSSLHTRGAPTNTTVKVCHRGDTSPECKNTTVSPIDVTRGSSATNGTTRHATGTKTGTTKSGKTTKRVSDNDSNININESKGTTKRGTGTACYPGTTTRKRQRNEKSKASKDISNERKGTTKCGTGTTRYPGKTTRKSKPKSKAKSKETKGTAKHAGTTKYPGKATGTVVGKTTTEKGDK